ncbi:MAG: transglutaminase domain-containing protein [Candidatus Poseidoniaceae archaeon]
MSAPIISEDGYWEYDGTEWVPTIKQKFALQGGLIPHNGQNIVSDDGFWELINGEWQPTVGQQMLRQNTANPYGQTEPVLANMYQPHYYYANPSPNNTKALIFVGVGFAIAILISIIVIVASISPELAKDDPVYEIGSGDNQLKSFSWEYDDRSYSVDFILNEGTYKHFKYKYEYCCLEDEDYLKYFDTDSDYIDEVAQVLNTTAIQAGYSSNLGKAEFILSFVGSIPYVFDPDDNFDHPKHPIETLWENGGDCEDSSALYASIMESLGYETVLVLLEAQAEYGDDWEGHAMVGIYIPNHSGEHFTLEGDWKNYYHAETTAWIDGETILGGQWWYDLDNIRTYQID